MPDASFAVLALLGLFTVKHFVADFVLQSPYILKNRRFYGHPGGILHTGIHAAGSLIVLVLMSTPPFLLLKILVVEALVHYHVDWAKDNIVLHFNMKPTERRYWIALGADQTVHQLTYVVMTLWWVTGI